MMTSATSAPSGTVRSVEPRWALDPHMRHLNHGSFGAVPEAVSAEQDRLRRLVEWNPVKWFATLPERIKIARVQMAELLTTEPERLAFVLNASAGASVVFQSLAHRGPVDVLTTDHGYGAITMGAERLAKRTGGRAHTVRIPLAAKADEVVQLVSTALEATRPTLLVIDQVTSATARAFPVDEICDVARDLGVLTLVDGAHAPGVLVDPVCTSADYWVGNLHKFACAPRGAGVLVSRDDGQELFPSIESWGTPLLFPQRFDSQGTLDATMWLTAPFAWQYLDGALGWETIRRMSAEVLDAGCRLVAEELGRHVADPVPDVGQPVATMRLLRLPEGLGNTLAAADGLRVPFMDATGVVVAFTHFAGRGYLRLSAHAYTTIHDFEQLARVGIPLLHQWARQAVNGTDLINHTKLEEEQCETNS